jgi:hypothetical protein
MYFLMNELRRHADAIIRIVQDNHFLPGYRRKYFLGELCILFRHMDEDFIYHTIESMRENKGREIDYWSVAERISPEELDEVLLLTTKEEHLNELLSGSCSVSCHENIKKVIHAGATTCDYCDDECHPQFWHKHKFLLIGHIGLLDDVLAVLKQMYCAIVPSGDF